jgi:hypothetical protein
MAKVAPRVRPKTAPQLPPFLPRIHPRPIRRQAPARCPLAQTLDLVARSDSRGYDVLRGLNERQEGG